VITNTFVFWDVAPCILVEVWSHHTRLQSSIRLSQLWHAGTSFFFLVNWLTGEGTVWPGSVKNRNVLRCCNSRMLSVVLPAGTQTETAYWALPVFVFHVVLFYIVIKFTESKVLNVKTQTTNNKWLFETVLARRIEIVVHKLVWVLNKEFWEELENILKTFISSRNYIGPILNQFNACVNG
jgi:hypothetical protein